MEVQNIIEIAEDRMMSELCLKWYLETNETKKKLIYENEIIPLYKMINKI